MTTKDNVTYSVNYTPRLEGPHTVHVKYNGRDILKSPFKVEVGRPIQLKPVSRPVSTAAAPSSPGT